jgi:hypothetical protein
VEHLKLADAARPRKSASQQKASGAAFAAKRAEDYKSKGEPKHVGAVANPVHVASLRARARGSAILPRNGGARETYLTGQLAAP